jgi:hypothetical protein
MTYEYQLFIFRYSGEGKGFSGFIWLKKDDLVVELHGAIGLI